MLSNNGVKIIVDYTDGYYKAVTYDNKNLIVIKKAIVDEFNRENYYKRNSLKQKRIKLLEDIRKLSIKNRAPLHYCERLVKDIDPIIYSVLSDVDKRLGTSYSLKYLESIFQNLYMRLGYLPKNEFEESCIQERTYDLNCEGISIEYNVGLLNASKSMNFLDKIKGIILAKKQKRILDIKVNSSIKTKDEYYYLDEIFEQVEELKFEKNKNESSKIINNEKEKKTIKDIEKVSFTRKIKDKCNSIRNKIYSRKNFGLKKIITGVVSLVSVGAIAIGSTISINNRGNNDDTVNDGVSIEEIQKNNINTDKNETSIFEFNKVEISTNKTNSFKASITESNKEKNDKNNNENKNKTKISENDSDKKTNQEKIKEFEDIALKKYLSSFIIGKKPNINGLLDNSLFYENNDGSGNKGSFKYHKNYSIRFINLLDDNDPNKFKTINTNGENLFEILEKYGKEYSKYSIAFEEQESGEGLGFVTKDQLEKLINNEIQSFISKKQFDLSNIGIER